jgi:hypothetical protein
MAVLTYAVLQELKDYIVNTPVIFISVTNSYNEDLAKVLFCCDHTILRH